MPCLDANDVVRFLDGGATPADEDHIDACEDCRALVTEIGRSLEPIADPDVASTGTDALARGSRDDIDVAAWELASGAELVARGARVGRYVVLDPIGAGAMGVVYRAYDPELDRQVALKVLKTAGKGAAAHVFRERLLREAQALARLSQPSIHFYIGDAAARMGDDARAASEFREYLAGTAEFDGNYVTCRTIAVLVNIPM